MRRPFREHHLFEMLEGYEKQQLPLDLFISHYFKANRALGSKDRGFIAETVYALVRWQGLLDYLCGASCSWETRFQEWSSLKSRNVQGIPEHIQCSFPKELFELLVKSHGLERAKELCLISNESAPTTIRANRLKISREDLLKKWKGVYEVSPCEVSFEGIIFHRKQPFFTMPEFKEGLFEVQDEGSQLLAKLVSAEPGQLVLDFCAGSGGKTLAFAPGMENQGQIFLHDIRPFALEESRKRLRRAGIQNGQVVQPDDETKLKKLKKKMDWVLADVPCTGTGTMRRNPDMKWKFTPDTLKRLVGQQRTIFEKALSFMKPSGRIVYGTCSMLKEENQEQVEHFIRTYGLEVEGEHFQTLPSKGGMDGFFGVVLKFSPQTRL